MPDKSTLNSESAIEVERAIDELRRQRGIVIYEKGGQTIGNYPVEFLTDAIFSGAQGAEKWLLITAARTKILNLGEVDMRVNAAKLSLADIQALADPLSDFTLPNELDITPASTIDPMALTLIKHASLLPALLLVKDPADMLLAVEAGKVREYLHYTAAKVIKTAEAFLPIEGAEKATLVSFRSEHATSVHLALLIGEINPATPPLTRIHSSCVTGDILGSLRCDCGDQLKLALSEITKAGSGILVYLHQEGRGIGITNKLRSYKLQERGFDTFTANRMLGFEEDERDFTIAAAILKSLGVGSIRLLTNNPHKLAAVEKAGITVTERVGLIGATSAHNHAYIEAKATKAGHIF